MQSECQRPSAFRRRSPKAAVSSSHHSGPSVQKSSRPYENALAARQRATLIRVGQAERLVDSRRRRMAQRCCPLSLRSRVFTRSVRRTHQEVAASALTIRFLFMAELAARIGVAGHAGLIRLQATASDYGSPVARRPDDNQAAKSDENFSLTFISYSAKSSSAKTSRHLPFVPLLKK